MTDPDNLKTSDRPMANVIIIVAIVIALACLVIPAIIAARANSRQIECANNIRQIALGNVNFNSSQKRFPVGTVLNELLPPESRLSWGVEVLPYIEATFLEFDRQGAWNEPKNLTQGGSRLFLCPDLEPAIKFGNLIQTAYVGPSGVGQESLSSTETRPSDGIWGYDRSTALDQICDGLDNTVLLMETSVKNGPWTAGGPPTVREIEETEQPPLGIGQQFGGLHAGITNVAFADGSAKPLNDDIDAKVLLELVRVCDTEQ